MPTHLENSQGLIAIGAKLINHKNIEREQLEHVYGSMCIVAARLDGFAAYVFHENTIDGASWKSNLVDKIVCNANKFEIHTVARDLRSMDHDSMSSMEIDEKTYQNLSVDEQWKALWSRTRNVQSKYIDNMTSGLTAEAASRYMNIQPKESSSQPTEKLLFEAKRLVIVDKLDLHAEIEYMIGIAHEGGLVTESELLNGKPGSSLKDVLSL